jgi:hypothetical protein
VNAVAFFVHGGMRVPTENAIDMMGSRIRQRPFGHLGRHSQKSRVPSVNQTGHRVALQIQLLQREKEVRSQAAQRQAVHGKAIELVPVNCKMLEPGIFPPVLLVHAHANQMRHYVSQADIVIPFDPHHFNFSLGIRELADQPEKLPVFFFQSAEIQVREDVAKKDQPPEGVFLQHAQRRTSAADFRAQMHV